MTTSKSLKTTKDELTEAFQKWNKDYIDNSDQYIDKLDGSKEQAIEQAEALIEIIEEIQNK